MQIAHHVQLKLIYFNYISVFRKIYMCLFFSVKGDVVGGGGSGRRDTKVYIREVIISFQLSNKFYWKHTILQRKYTDSSECRGEGLSAWESMSSGQTPDEAPTCQWSVRGLLIPAKRSAFPFSLPHLLPALSCLFWMVSRCGSWMTGVQWKQTNSAEGIFHIPFRCEQRHRETPAGVWVWKTAYLLLCPDACSGLPEHLGKPRSWGKWSRIQLLTQVSHLFKRNALQHRCPLPGDEDIDMTCQASCPVTQAASRGPCLGISTSSHLRFLALPGLPGGSPVSPGLLGEVPSLPRPSWGSPQPRQAFLEELPNFPGSFLRAQGYGGHRQSDPWVTYCVLQTHSLQLCVCWNPRPWAL